MTEYKYLGSRIVLEDTFLSWSFVLQRQIIPYTHIATVVTRPGFASVIVHTTSGQKITMPCRLRDKGPIMEAIARKQAEARIPVDK